MKEPENNPLLRESYERRLVMTYYNLVDSHRGLSKLEARFLLSTPLIFKDAVLRWRSNGWARYLSTKFYSKAFELTLLGAIL